MAPVLSFSSWEWGALFGTVLDVRAHDYVAAMLWATVGLSLVRAAVALLRPSMGE